MLFSIIVNTRPSMIKYIIEGLVLATRSFLSVAKVQI